MILALTLGYMLISKVLDLRTTDKREHAKFIFGGCITPFNIIFSKSFHLPANFISFWFTAQ